MGHRRSGPGYWYRRGEQHPPNLARLIVAAALLTLSGCSTTWFWEATVNVIGPVTGTCVEAYLETQQDLFNIESAGRDAVAARVRLAGTKDKDAPSISITQGSEWNQPVLRLSTSYRTGALASESETILRERAKQLSVAITLACTGQHVELGPEHPCGSGEPHALCATAE